MRSEIDADDIQQLFSPKRKRLLSHTTSKKSTTNHFMKTPLTTSTDYTVTPIAVDENNKNGSNRLSQNSPVPSSVDHSLSAKSYLNHTDSEFPSLEMSTERSMMSQYQSPQVPKRSMFPSSSSFINSNHSNNNSNVFTDLDMNSGFGEDTSNSKFHSGEEFNVFSSGKRSVRSTSSSIFGSADRNNNTNCDLWGQDSPPRSVRSGRSSRAGTPNHDDSIERLHQSYLASARDGLSSPADLRHPLVAPLSVHSSGGSRAHHSRRMLFASGGGGGVGHRRGGGSSSSGDQSDTSSAGGSQSSIDLGDDNFSAFVRRPVSKPVSLRGAEPLKSISHHRGGVEASPQTDATESGLDQHCMAGRMSSLSVTRRGSKHGRAPFEDEEALGDGDDMPPPHKHHVHHSPKGFGKALFRDDSVACSTDSLFSSTPIVSRGRGSALFGGGADLGTPLTERGSPAVMHDMDYEHAGEDDEDGEEGGFDRFSAMRSFGASPVVSALSQGTQSALQHYSMFASRVMDHDEHAHQHQLGRPDFHRSRPLHDVGLPPFSSHKRLVTEDSSSVDHVISSDITADLSHDHTETSNGHLTMDLMDTSTTSTQQTESGSANSSLLDTSTTLSVEGGGEGLSAGGTGFSAFTRTKLHRRVNSRGLASRNSSNNSSCTNMSLSLDQSTTSSRNASTATEVGVFRPLPDQSAFDLTLSNSVQYNDLGAFSGGSETRSGGCNKMFSSPLGDAVSSLDVKGMFSPNPSSPQRSAAWSVDSVTEKRLAREQEAARQQTQHLFYGLGSLSSSSLDLHHFPPPFKMTRQTSLVDNKLLLAQDDDDQTDTLGNTLDQFSTESHHLPHGDICFVRDFVNEGLLGSGTFADVYKVTQRNSTDTKFYAVKKSRRQFQSKRDRDWLLNEVRTMKLLGDSHHHRPCPYIIQFVRAWQEDSFFYVQIGLAEKGTLRDLMNDLVDSNMTLPDETLYRITHDVSAGLKHIHDCEMIHLDIKPANLLITQGGLIQIGDFGMATYKGSRDDGHEGDTRYMAHELLNETERMPSADIFSLGLTLYELSYSRQRLENGCISLPFDGPLWHALRQGRAEAVTDRPAMLVEVISKAMAPQPRDRPSALQILQVAEVRAAKDRQDPTLLAAKPIATQSQAALNRSSSFNPAFMSSLSITTGLTTLPADEYALLMERAFTPH